MKKIVWKDSWNGKTLKPNEIRKHIPDLYVQCYCGSGQKYKFCCYQKDDKIVHNQAEMYQQITKNRRVHKYCIYKNCECSNEIIQAHSIQNNKILSKLAEDNHVYIVDFDAYKFGAVDFKKCGKNEATTSTCFCSYHDSKLFSSIELNEYRYEEKQNFLYAYRAFSKYYYDRIIGLEDTRSIFKIAPNNSISMGLVERIKGLEISVEENENIRNEFNNALKNEDYSTIKTITLSLDYEVGFATSYMSPLSYDLEGRQISDVYSLEGRMRNIYVSIFPENGKTYILISWLKSDDGDWFANYAGQFQKIQDKKETLIRVLNNMVACQSDNVVFGKKLLDAWGEEVKEVFLHQCLSSFLALNGENIGLTIEKNISTFDCKFNLFEKV